MTGYYRYKKKGILRSIRRPENISRKNRPNLELPNTVVAGLHNSGKKGDKKITVQNIIKQPKKFRKLDIKQAARLRILPERNNPAGA